MALERFLAKHVRINHHARLVLFLRAQNMITELEAEVLEPTLGGVTPTTQLAIWRVTRCVLVSSHMRSRLGVLLG